MDNNYKYLDLTYLEGYFKKDKNLIAELFRMFLKSAPEDHEILKKKIEEGTPMDIKMYAHRLKSAFRYLGADSMGKMFELIEKSALTNVEIGIIRKQYADTLSSFDNYIIEIQRFIELTDNTSK